MVTCKNKVIQNQNWRRYFKSSLYNQLNAIGVDRVMRFFYRERLLVLMYHGITKNKYPVPAWTQLPRSIFFEQIKWIATKFRPVSLSNVVDSIVTGRQLPNNSVLVSFDDGLKNNLTVAYPILKKFSVPAAIFVTVDFVNTDKFFWVDELWMAISEAGIRQQDICLSTELANKLFKKGRYWPAYYQEVEFLKILPEAEQKEKVLEIIKQISWCKGKYREDFGMLSWEEVRILDRGGLVEFGAHTATHQILTRMKHRNLDDELFGAKRRMEFHLDHEVSTFCYPNGRFGIDYLPTHRDLLKKGGYKCAFGTNCGLYKRGRDHNFSIPRVSVGNDFLSNENFFKLNVSGLAEIRKK